jgi:hypothetical protein
MNDTVIVTTYAVIDDVMKACGHTDHGLAQVGDAEVLTVAIVAALYFHNHHERAVVMMHRLGYLSGQLSVSRFNRRIHRLADWLAGVWELLSALLRGGALYLIDSLPVPVCKWVRGRNCRGCTMASVGPSARTSSAGVCIWFSHRMAFRSPSSCCPPAVMI